MGRLISQQAAIEAVEFGITYAKAIDTKTGEVRELFKQSNEELRKAVERIKALPPAQPDTTTHDSIPAKTGKNDGDKTSGDCISRQTESNPMEKCYTCKHVYQRVSDADTLYCRCRKGCRYEEFKPKRSNCTAEKS